MEIPAAERENISKRELIVKEKRKKKIKERTKR
jgi:hypothetical protein